MKNWMLSLKPPHNGLHFIDILLSPNIYTFSDTEPFWCPHPIFSALLNLNFLTWRTKNSKFPKSILVHYPNPNWTKRAQKTSNWSSSWPWNRCTHTFGRPCLQVIWFGSHWFGSLFPKATKLCNLPQITWKKARIARPFCIRTFEFSHAFSRFLFCSNASFQMAAMTLPLLSSRKNLSWSRKVVLFQVSLGD